MAAILRPPLTEQNAASRTYHADKTVYTAGGVFVAQVKQLATITLTDSAGTTVVLTLQAPT